MTGFGDAINKAVLEEVLSACRFSTDAFLVMPRRGSQGRVRSNAMP